jgi:2'-5' RNA ligase
VIPLKLNIDSLSLYRLYFVAIVPPDAISGQVTTIKEEFASRFNSAHALRSPPHITLHMPFKWREDKIQKVKAVLEKAAKQISPFEIGLDGFAAFPPRVIYVDIMQNETLELCQKSVIKAMRSLHILNADYKDRPFHPHMTVAFRDLKKAAFHEAWKEFQGREFAATFEAKSIVLLKHYHEPGQTPQWVIETTFPMSG